uniref:Uncharacterized protein n=1 Tax=Chromera velia CCMP2878 TaxID=1169474 RepID=A0A0G4HFM9_9ALVE|eukprot:Cvel_27094.t1-p1 / transcript=Cvel_27094.t1 / gene=Cvel_27094 / organism=Chromera_velia_CCMP2878 / gene_product=hypothetical protein / transcript_product=hypothetical protein / location=Cvel_scaffold3321:1477-3678(-) / protein_length=466 / sequence_SO=supercontig / SO=protein_coding / is_pseudo=false
MKCYMLFFFSCLFHGVRSLQLHLETGHTEVDTHTQGTDKSPDSILNTEAHLVPSRSVLDAGCTPQAVQQLRDMRPNFHKKAVHFPRGPKAYSFGVKLLHAFQRTTLVNEYSDSSQLSGRAAIFSSSLEAIQRFCLPVEKTFKNHKFKVKQFYKKEPRQYCRNALSRLVGVPELIDKVMEAFSARCDAEKLRKFNPDYRPFFENPVEIVKEKEEKPEEKKQPEVVDEEEKLQPPPSPVAAPIEPPSPPVKPPSPPSLDLSPSISRSLTPVADSEDWDLPSEDTYFYPPAIEVKQGDVIDWDVEPSMELSDRYEQLLEEEEEQEMESLQRESQATPGEMDDVFEEEKQIEGTASLDDALARESEEEKEEGTNGQCARWPPEALPSPTPTKKENVNPYNVLISQNRCCRVCGRPGKNGSPGKSYACRNGCVSTKNGCQYREDSPKMKSKKEDFLKVNMPGCACDFECLT